MDKLKLLIKGQEQNTFTIHYSCDGFYNGGAVAPTICCIAMTNLKTLELHTFALQNYILKGKSLIDAEKQLIEDFVNFYKKLKNLRLVHWNMGELGYGFKSISARLENFGVYDLDFSNAIILDFCPYSYRNLLKTLEEYQCSSPYILDGRNEAVCFDKRSYNTVKLSTEAKSMGLAKLLNLALLDKIYLGSADIVEEED